MTYRPAPLLTSLPAEEMAKIVLRVPKAVRDRIEAAARASGEDLHGFMMTRVVSSIGPAGGSTEKRA